MPLSDIFNNRLDDFVDSSNDNDVISHRQGGYPINPWLLAIGRNEGGSDSIMEEEAVRRNKVIGHSKMKEKTVGTNRVASHCEIKEGDGRRNRVVSYSGIEQEMERGTNNDLSDVSFYREIVNYN